MVSEALNPMKKLEEMEVLNNDMAAVLNKRNKTIVDKTLLRGILEKDVEWMEEGPPLRKVRVRDKRRHL